MISLTDVEQVPNEALPYVVFVVVLASIFLAGGVVRKLVRRMRWRYTVDDDLISVERRREIRRRKRRPPRIPWHPITPVVG